MVDPIKVSKGGTYTPQWGNDGREDGEKIVVHYRFLSFAEQQELLNSDDIKAKNFAYESRIVARMVSGIDHLSVEDGNGVRAITTGDELINEPGLDALAYELWMEFRSKSAVDKKKSTSASSSGSKDGTTKQSEKK